MVKKYDKPEEYIRRLEESNKDLRANAQKEKCLVIRIDGWLGRVVAMSWAITEKAKQQPVKVITSRPLVFWWNPYIKSVHWLDDRRLFEDVIKGNDYMELEPYTDPKFFNDAVNWLEIAREKLWLEEIAQPVLFLAEHEKTNNFLNWDRPLLFQPFGSTMTLNGSDKSYRSIPIEQAQYMANKMIEQWFTVYVVERDDQPKLKWCQQLTAKDMRWLATLCYRYPVIWCDSSLHHIAKAFGRKSIVLWAWTDWERYGYESHINMREFPMVAHTPLRLNLNDFNFDISNQHTNQFSNEFLDKAISQIPLLYK